MSKYFPERIWPRLVPNGSIMVSIYALSGQAYGVMSDVSEGGAQILAGVHFEPGSRVLLRIGFDPEQPFSTQGEVVWSRDDSDDKHKASYLHGVRFLIDDAEQRAALSAILKSPQFEARVLPDGSPRTTGMNALMSELSDELGKLGEKIRNET